MMSLKCKMCNEKETYIGKKNSTQYEGLKIF